MNARQELQATSVMHCKAILGNKAFRHPEIDPLRRKFDEAADAMYEIQTRQGVEHLRRSSDGGQLEAMRKDVRKRLQRISRLAIGVLDGVPGIRQDVRVPHAHANDADLLKGAARIIKNLRPHVATLHEAGLPRDAFPKLLSQMKLLKAKSADADTAIARRSRATASLPSAIRRARNLARALDSVIKAKLGADAIAQWTAVYRIPRKMGRPKKRAVRPGQITASGS